MTKEEVMPDGTKPPITGHSEEKSTYWLEDWEDMQAQRVATFLIAPLLPILQHQDYPLRFASTIGDRAYEARTRVVFPNRFFQTGDIEGYNLKIILPNSGVPQYEIHIKMSPEQEVQMVRFTADRTYNEESDERFSELVGELPTLSKFLEKLYELTKTREGYEEHGKKSIELDFTNEEAVCSFAFEPYIFNAAGSETIIIAQYKQHLADDSFNLHTCDNKFLKGNKKTLPQDFTREEITALTYDMLKFLPHPETEFAEV